MSPREHSLRVQDILNRIDRIMFAERYLREIEQNALQIDLSLVSSMILDSILFSLMVIGEAVKALNPAMKARNDGVPWHEIIGLRNALAHQYFNTDVETIKVIINLPLMQLKKVCELEVQE